MGNSCIGKTKVIEESKKYPIYGLSKAFEEREEAEKEAIILRKVYSKVIVSCDPDGWRCYYRINDKESSPPNFSTEPQNR